MFETACHTNHSPKLAHADFAKVGLLEKEHLETVA